MDWLNLLAVQGTFKSLLQHHGSKASILQCSASHHYPLLRWRLLDTHGKSGSVSCGGTAPFSWVLVHIRFCLCPPRVLFPQSCVSSGDSVVVLMATSSKRAYAVPRSAAPRALPLRQATVIRTSAGDTQTLKGRSGFISVGSPVVHNVLFVPSECLWWV